MAKIVLKKYWSYDSFRPKQADIISNVLRGNDTLALLPTGGGKSLCFQIPALVKDGVCIVISPLIALMKDQITQLKSRGIRADAIYSGMSYRDMDRIFDNAVYGHLKLLYISPERLKTELAIHRIGKMPVSLIAVDEAHCISQWGYDFRPAYLEINAIREWHPKVPIIALTATATDKVAEDILNKLEFRSSPTQEHETVFKNSFARRNLSINVLEESIKEHKLIEILKKYPGASIIYLRNRGKTVKVAQFLSIRGFSVDFYHAGLSPKERDQKQALWIQGNTEIMVCTNAFGMGIDKSNVRTVIHLDIPESVESYYQEAGRAGRDSKKSNTFLLWNQNDKNKLITQFNFSYPDIKEIKAIYQLLGSYFQLAYGAGKDEAFAFDLLVFSKKYKGELAIVVHALSWLEKNELICLSDNFGNSEKVFIPHPKNIYNNGTKFQSELVKAIFRLHEGVKLYSVNLKLDQVARWLEVSIEKCRFTLEKMNNLGLLKFESNSSSNKIIFLEERLRPESIVIDKILYNNLKLRSKNRIKFMFNFLRIDGCRQNYILDYFNEDHQQDCGHCDNCTKEHLSQSDIQKRLLNQMGDSSVFILDIIQLYRADQKDAVFIELNRLIDGGLVEKIDDKVRKI